MPPTTMYRHAERCGNHRYTLTRRWDADLPVLSVCMLNPSTADAMSDDATLYRLIHFAGQWGYGGLFVVNLYAWRSPHPWTIFAEIDRVGADNDAHLDAAIALAAAGTGKLLVAWGNMGDQEGHAQRFVARVRRHRGVELICLGTTLSGAPKHPMARGRGRPADDLSPQPWPTPAMRDQGAPTCTVAERALLDAIAAWPDVPVSVTWRADDTWSISEMPKGGALAG